jgi:hypothetical protein
MTGRLELQVKICTNANILLVVFEMNVDWNNLQRRFDAKYVPEPNSGCWLWLGALNVHGYGVISTGAKTAVGNKLAIVAHRASFLLSNGPDSLDGGFFACHRCDLPCCVNPDHLFKGTNQDDLDDAAIKGRLWSVLNEDQVRSILADNDNDSIVASKYGVDRKTIGNIRTGRNWKHVSGVPQILNRRIPTRTSASETY